MEDCLTDIVKELGLTVNVCEHNVFEETARILRIAYLKENYSRDYLLKYRLCTAEEYDSTPASTDRADALRRAQEIAHLWNQVVGAEID